MYTLMGRMGVDTVNEALLWCGMIVVLLCDHRNIGNVQGAVVTATFQEVPSLNDVLG